MTFYADVPFLIILVVINVTISKPDRITLNPAIK